MRHRREWHDLGLGVIPIDEVLHRDALAQPLRLLELATNCSVPRGAVKTSASRHSLLVRGFGADGLFISSSTTSSCDISHLSFHTESICAMNSNDTRYSLPCARWNILGSSMSSSYFFTSTIRLRTTSSASSDADC
jgi:hypothetical protein